MRQEPVAGMMMGDTAMRGEGAGQPSEPHIQGMIYRAQRWRGCLGRQCSTLRPVSSKEDQDIAE